MSQLQLVPPEGAPRKHATTVEELLSLLGPQAFDAIEQKIRVIRETFNCPPTVRDYEEFKDVLYDYYGHYQKAYFNADLKGAAARVGAVDVWRQTAYRFLQEHLGSHHAMLTAERNAIKGREGGMIRVIDEYTDAIIKRHTQVYIETVFYERIAFDDYPLRMRLAAELLKRVGPMFPGEELLPEWVVGWNIQEVIAAYAQLMYPVRRLLRR